MAENEQLIIELSVETVGLVKSLATVENGLRDFAKEGKTTAATLTAALSAINKEAKNTFDVNALANYNKALQEIRTTLSGVRKIGIAPGVDNLEKLDENARRARISVYGLNQVVRDLPFGFIAISNNIPVLTDQLQELYRVNNGKVLPTLKNFGTALFGAAGIGIAISAVTSLVTYAIQEYGSLSNALKALFGDYTTLDEKLKKATEQLEKFNKELKTSGEVTAIAQSQVSADIQQYQALSQIIFDLNGNYANQQSALKLLQKGNKEFFGDINNVADAQKRLGQRLSEYNNLVTSESRVNAIKKEITATDQQIFQQQELLRQQKERIAELEKLPKLVTGAGREIETPELANLRKDAATTQTAIEQLYGTWSGFNNTLITETNNLTVANQALLKILDAQTKSQQEKQTQEKVRTFQLEREKKLLEQQLENIGIQSEEYLRIKTRIVEISGELKKIGENDSRIIAQIEIDTNISKGQLYRELDKDIAKEEKESAKRPFRVALNIDPELKIKTKVGNTIAEQLRADIVEKYQDGLPIPFALQLDAKKKEKAEKELEEIRNRQQAAYAELGQFVGRFLNSGIQTFVEGLEEGKSAADSLRDSFKKIGDELKKIIIKLAVIEGIKLLANILAPGSGAKIGAGLSQALGVPDLTGLLGGNKQQAVRGLNVGPGGLAIAGNVTFVQRGPDLVGVLTAANSRINRVG